MSVRSNETVSSRGPGRLPAGLAGTLPDPLPPARERACRPGLGGGNGGGSHAIPGGRAALNRCRTGLTALQPATARPEQVARAGAPARVVAVGTRTSTVHAAGCFLWTKARDMRGSCLLDSPSGLVRQSLASPTLVPGSGAPNGSGQASHMGFRCPCTASSVSNTLENGRLA